MLRRLPSPLRSHAAVAAIVAVALSVSGCTSALLTAAYMIKGVETPPEFEGLKDKKTAVVCRPLVELQYSGSDAANLLARNVGMLMKAKGKKINTINAEKIEAWMDEHEWEEFSEIGKAMKSDFVVGIELEQFSLYQGQTIYQGKARAHVTVHDLAKNGEVVFEKRIDRIVYPPNSGVATSDKTEDQFRREFIAVIADRIGRSFYPHDHRDDYAVDTLVLD